MIEYYKYLVFTIIESFKRTETSSIVKLVVFIRVPIWCQKEYSTYTRLSKLNCPIEGEKGKSWGLIDEYLSKYI